MKSLSAQSITVRFGGLSAVSDVTVDVPSGGFAGLIGPNGAGKTTLFNVISGFTPATAGRVVLDGRDVTRTSVAARARLGLGRTFQRLELFGRMTVFDNVMVAAEARSARTGLVSDLLHLPARHRGERDAAAVARDVLSLLDLEWAAERRAADLPVGSARIVELARALAGEPAVLLLDEPSSGLDANETSMLGHLLERVNGDRGVTILLVEHDMDLVMRVAREIFVLDFGRLIASGTPPTVQKNPAVRAAYLGEEDDAAAAAPSRR